MYNLIRTKLGLNLVLKYPLINFTRSDISSKPYIESSSNSTKRYQTHELYYGKFSAKNEFGNILFPNGRNY
jgi:hypothetical protein